MFGIKTKTNKTSGVLRRLNEKIQELNDFITTTGKYCSYYEIQRIKIMIQELEYIKTGRKK